MALAARQDHLHVDVIAMRRRHIRSVIRIEKSVYRRPWSAALFHSELALGANRQYIVARVDRSVVGYAGLMFAGDDAHVTTIAVSPDWQRRGVGTRLLVALTRCADAHGSLAMTLEVRESNDEAATLYDRFGFAAAGRRRGYYADSGEDAIVMWARDIRTAQYRARVESNLMRVVGTTLFEVPA